MNLYPTKTRWTFRQKIDGKQVTKPVAVPPDDPVAAVAYVREHYNGSWQPSDDWLEKYLPDAAPEPEPAKPVEVVTSVHSDRTGPAEVREDNMRLLMFERDNADYAKDRIAATKELNRMLRDDLAKPPPTAWTDEQICEAIASRVGRLMGLSTNKQIEGNK